MAVGAARERYLLVCEKEGVFVVGRSVYTRLAPFKKAENVPESLIPLFSPSWTPPSHVLGGAGSQT